MGGAGAPYGTPTLLSFGSIPGATHGNARPPLHLLHGRHTRHTSHTWHTLHWSTRQIGCAIGAEGPAEFQQTLALGAGTLEFLTTGGANLKIRLNACMTIGAGLALGHLCQQRFVL